MCCAQRVWDARPEEKNTFDTLAYIPQIEAHSLRSDKGHPQRYVAHDEATCQGKIPCAILSLVLAKTCVLCDC